MNQSDPLLTSSGAVLWLKVLLTLASLIFLYLRYRRRSAPEAAPRAYSVGTKVFVVLAVLFSFALFHSFGSPRSGKFVHDGEMFHYYLGSKYFPELGHYELYNAVIVADAEQDSALAGLPFYTDLTTYQNASRDAALSRGKSVKAPFSKARWRAFKRDVGFFKKKTGMPSAPGISFFLMDHGYNASPVSTLVLGALTNLVPVTQLPLLASLDVALVAVMVALVFRAFGLLTGGVFSVYFFVNILNDHGYISGGLLRYDWLLCVVAAVCLLEKGRSAAAAFFLTAAAMLKVFPAVVFVGIGVTLAQRVKTQGSVDRDTKRFVFAAAATAAALFLLPALYLGSVVQPWQDFAEKTALHDRGVYVNHLGLRGVVLFEPSHLSLDAFVETYASGSTGDLVRHWQDVKEQQYEERRPWVIACTVLVLACIAAILWKRRRPLRESVLLPWVLVYVASYPSHYYYAFLCLLVLLFLMRPNTRAALVPLGLLLVLNLAALVTDAFSPSPIVFYTLVNAYLFVCFAAMLVFELVDAFRTPPEPQVAALDDAKEPPKRGRSKGKPRGSRRVAVGALRGGAEVTR